MFHVMYMRGLLSQYSFIAPGRSFHQFFVVQLDEAIGTVSSSNWRTQK